MPTPIIATFTHADHQPLHAAYDGWDRAVTMALRYAESHGIAIDPSYGEQLRGGSHILRFPNLTIELSETINADFEDPDKAEPVETEEDPVYLYILMRNDLDSLNPGKAVAQGTHAANQMVHEARAKNDPGLNIILDEWAAETPHGFGTCITLGVSYADLQQIVDRAVFLGIHSAITHDPSYPLRDGKTMHFIPLDTCGYVFDRKSGAKSVVGGFNLMP